MRVLWALSGPVGVGKSSFCEVLETCFGAKRLSTRELLLATGAKNDREDLQEAGERLDRDRNGKWVANALAAKLSGDCADIVIVDAIRIKKQIDHIRRAFGARFRVWHVFVDADDEVLRERYRNRENPIGEFADCDQLKQSETERAIRSLKSVADRVVDGTRCEPDSVAAQAVAGLGLFPLEIERLVDIVVGGNMAAKARATSVAISRPAMTCWSASVRRMPGTVRPFRRKSSTSTYHPGQPLTPTPLSS